MKSAVNSFWEFEDFRKLIRFDSGNSGNRFNLIGLIPGIQGV
jgi:hypothetical protein